MAEVKAEGPRRRRGHRRRRGAARFATVGHVVEDDEGRRRGEGEVKDGGDLRRVDEVEGVVVAEAALALREVAAQGLDGAEGVVARHHDVVLRGGGRRRLGGGRCWGAGDRGGRRRRSSFMLKRDAQGLGGELDDGDAAVEAVAAQPRMQSVGRAPAALPVVERRADAAAPPVDELVAGERVERDRRGARAVLVGELHALAAAGEEADARVAESVARSLKFVPRLVGAVEHGDLHGANRRRRQPPPQRRLERREQRPHVH
mmetsp:Transcript_7734/g.31998  ORF Transcript_7734/g.31998 Transcript_7734/m.31998 type:complete len:260 (-) Transcript_7734:175-954(-)